VDSIEKTPHDRALFTSSTVRFPCYFRKGKDLPA
jgi:hypothetical protein